MRRRFLPADPIALAVVAAGFCALVAGSAALAAGCAAGRSELDVEPPDAGVDAAPVPDAGLPPIEISNKVDLLLVIDNSPNTEGFQALLGATVPYLLDRFTNPVCVNGLGDVVAVTPSPTDPCPTGERDFHAVDDLHIAVVSTSLGGHGADTCSPASPLFDPAQNDAAHLLTRGPGGVMVPTYQSQGFLAWDPAQKAIPPGEGDLGALGQNLADLATGAGDKGCGFEAQLESMYRFLVDPDPYLTIPIVGGQAAPTGTDTTVLQQRADFLRPDSLLQVVLITDEDDCSTREGGSYYFSLQGLDPGAPGKLLHLPRARSECAVNENDLCCASCGQSPPAGCPPNASDPSCGLPPFSDAEDPLNLRCFDQKRRFGIDFLYPVQRYVDALTQPMIAARDGVTMVQNPLFAGNRSPKLVLMTGIVGVPWEDISRSSMSLVTGYKPATEIDWGLLLDDPAKAKLPSDPLMIRSVAPRMGVNPPTGFALAPPGSPPLANPINGHERSIPLGDDLQYACIFARPTPKLCTAGPCNCVAPDIDQNPICQAPDGTYSHAERFERALPSTRDLRVLQGLGERATVASVCAPVTSGPDAPAFGYKPAVDAMMRTLRLRIQ